METTKKLHDKILKLATDRITITDEATTTVQVYKKDLLKLNEIADRAQPLRDVIRNMLDSNEDNSNPTPYTDYGTSEYNKTKVPANGRVRLTKAGGKVIEWRIRE